MARETRTVIDEAVAALTATEFCGQLVPGTYVSRTETGTWTPIELASLNGKPRHSGGTFEKTGTRTELIAVHEAAASLADDNSVKFVGLETASRLVGFKGPLLTIGREQEGKVVIERFPLAQGEKPLNGSRRIVETVLTGVPGVVRRIRG